MPGAWTDLSVAARLGARLVARRFSGSGDDAPDLRSFRDTLENGVTSPGYGAGRQGKGIGRRHQLSGRTSYGDAWTPRRRRSDPEA
jgi:hypothetical protein